MSPVSADQVETILAEVCASFLGGEEAPPVPAPRLDADAPAAPAAGAVASSWVDVHGDWSGTVVVAVGRAAADRLAGALWRRPVSEVGLDDVEDALGELANVVGGNVKAVAADGGALGLPQVSLGAAHRPAAPASEVCRAAVSWRGDPLEVVVWGRDHSGGAR